METKEMEILYKEIAEHIYEMIPVKWNTIWMYAEMLDDSASALFYFTVPNKEEYYYSHNIPEEFQVSEDTYDSLLINLQRKLRRLREDYAEVHSDKWTTVTIKLTSLGEMSKNFGYEDVYSLGIDHIQRRAVWEYETFGFLPEDEEDKEAVLNYLKIQTNA
ncbi:immunity protein YezG family protein [Bacillus safensis]|uniref:immunity protein YezG family protein n=1 Tax=Bacillus safensis TaxID=561879 RepID=UPI001F4E3620|nr:immunity protein YezG family protein [Bacillus safensis]